MEEQIAEKLDQFIKDVNKQFVLIAHALAQVNNILEIQREQIDSLNERIKRYEEQHPIN